MLVLLVSPWWLLFPAFVGAASVVFAWSGFCIVANAMWHLGAEPRLGPGLAVPTPACCKGEDAVTA